MFLRGEGMMEGGNCNSKFVTIRIMVGKRIREPD